MAKLRIGLLAVAAILLLIIVVENTQEATFKLLWLKVTMPLALLLGVLLFSGMAVGWLHLAAGFVKRSFLGKAWLTISTYDLTSKAAAENPLAPHLLRAIVESSP